MKWFVEEEEILEENWNIFLENRDMTIKQFDKYMSKKLNKTPKAIFMKRQRLDLTDYKKIYMQSKKYKKIMTKSSKKIWSLLTRRKKQSIDRKNKIKLGIIKKPIPPRLCGKNSPHWKGGKSRFRGKDWKQQREKVIKLFGNICYNCGRTNCKIDIHHIEPYNISKNNNISNLIPLCVRCHKQAHNKQLPHLIRGEQN